MLKPSNIPGAVTDTLDFVKNLWGAMNVPGVTTLPGMAAPTLSVEELDKKINDLKAVESWLNLNMGMLRGSIHALEVQRDTIATLKSMGATLSSAVKQTGGKVADRSLLDSIPYASAFLFPNANPVPTTPDEMEANINPHAGEESPPENEAKSAEPADKGLLKQADLGAQIAQAGAWWGMLQEQFKQAVSSAMAADSSRSEASSETAPPAKSSKTVKKPNTKKPAPTRARKKPAE